MKYIFATLLLFSLSVHALDFFKPPGIFTHSPSQTFKHQKSWFYHSKQNNSYIYQAYLPDFNHQQITHEFALRLVTGTQLTVNASKWQTNHQYYHPTQTLLTFSETINLPKINRKATTTTFIDQVFTVTMPSP